MNLFMTGEFQLRGGGSSRWKIECDALTPDDWEGLALMASEQFARYPIKFGKVEGVPRGGLPFALALGKYADPGSDVLLVAEDVCTTGGSMERHRAGRAAVGVCAFARSWHWPPWVMPVFVMAGTMPFAAAAPPAPKEVACVRCLGTGQTLPRTTPAGGTLSDPCPDCGGTGTVEVKS